MPDQQAGPSDGGVMITGAAAVACLGTDARQIWTRVREGVCGMAPMPEIESPLPEGSVGGQALDLPGLYRPELSREARYVRWTIEHALRDAGLLPNSCYDPSRIRAVLGTTLHGIRAGGRFLRTGNLMELDAFLASATMQHAIAGLGIEGGGITTCSACSSSLGAVALGVTLLETGQADVVVAGGYDAISEYAWAGFNSLRLIASGPLRPFCKDRQGMKIAEGYGIVVLEREAACAARGKAGRVRVAGWGESADAHHLTQPHPEGTGALAAMRQALSRAEMSPQELGMVAAHATGTPDNDGAEFAALAGLFGADLSRIPIVAFKSFLGHTLGGAGAVELVLSAMAIQDGTAPACPNVRKEEIEFPALRVTNTSPVALETSTALNTSLGFGGANTCVVLTDRRSPALPKARRTNPEAWITGLGIILPGTVGHAAFLERTRTASGWSSAGIDDTSIAEYLNVRRARRMSQYVKATLAAAAMAARDAGLAGDTDRTAGASAILGTMHGSACYCYDYYSQIIREGPLAANPVLFAEGVPNAAAAHLSATLQIKGSCQTIIGSRAAGLDALALAALRVRSGAVETVLVVAAEEPCSVVDSAYRARGLLAGDDKLSLAHGQRAVESIGGGVALVVESSVSAAARGASPYAVVRESACATSRPCGAASNVSSVISRLGKPDRVIGSACGTWIDRAELLGARRAGLRSGLVSIADRFAEAFSVTPLIAIAAELAGEHADKQFAVLCTDWSGASSGVRLERLSRRLSGAQS